MNIKKLFLGIVIFCMGITAFGDCNNSTQWGFNCTFDYIYFSTYAGGQISAVGKVPGPAVNWAGSGDGVTDHVGVRIMYNADLIQNLTCYQVMKDVQKNGTNGQPYNIHIWANYNDVHNQSSGCGGGGANAASCWTITGGYSCELLRPNNN